jgi:hypothetical protein
MTKEGIIEASVWIIMIIALLLFVPKNRMREASDVYLITQLSYFAAYCSIMTLLEVLIGHYTQLIHYIKWTWYWTWISLFLTFYISRLYYVWFFRIKSKT